MQALKVMGTPLLFVITITWFIFTFGTQQVHAATATWDGGGVDTNLSTAENWLGDVAPAPGDDLVFDTDVASFSSGLVNDFTADTAFNSLTVNGSTVQTVNITGNSLVLGDIISSQDLELQLDITIASNSIVSGSSTVMLGLSNGSSVLTLNGDLSSTANSLIVHSVLNGSSAFTNSLGAAYISQASSFAGDININGGELIVDQPGALGASSGATNIGGGLLKISAGGYDGTSMSIVEPIVLNGGSISLSDDHMSPGSGAASASTSVDFDGQVTVSAATEVVTTAWFADALIDFPNATGSNVGGFTLASGSSGTMKVNGSVVAGNEGGSGGSGETTLSDSKPGVSVTIGSNQTYIINGQRGNIVVQSGGTLKGTGTVGNVTILTGGSIAPGLSPGCIATGDLVLNSGSVMQVEIEGSTVCTEYDQTQVTGTVDLGSATLSIQRLSAFTPTLGQEFVIVQNDGADATTGIFSGLIQGAEIIVDGITYQVSYVAGDGNDVSLTVTDLGTPTAPPTGFSLLSIQPFMLVAGIFSALIAWAVSLKLFTQYKVQ